MKLFFNKKTAIFGLLILLFVAGFSCGQLSLDNHGGFFGSEASECSTFTSTVSNLSSKESLVLIGSLLILVALSVFTQNLLWKGRFYALDPPESLVTFVPKQIHTVTNQMQEAFRKGIIHSQIYDTVKASG